MADPMPTSHNLDLAMAGCMLVALGVLVFAFVTRVEIPDASHETLLPAAPVVDVARLEAERQTHYPAPRVEASGEVNEMLRSAREANVAQFGSPTEKEGHDLQVKTMFAATDLITEISLEAFIPAGQPMFDTCATAFDALLEAVRAGKLSIEDAAKDPGEDHQLYRENCGNALGSLIESKVVTRDGQWADPVSGPHLLEIMNRYRWASVLDLRKSAAEQLSPYEYELLTRWQASVSSIPVERRVQRVVAAKRVNESLQEKEIIGSLLYESGDVVGAFGAYNEACEERPGDLHLKRKCDYLRERAVQGGYKL